MNLEKLLCVELKRQLEAKGVCMTHIPAGGEMLWKWFNALNRTRQVGMSGPQSITYAEIAGYSTIARQAIEPRHVAILIAMDQTYLDCVYTKAAPLPEGVKALPPISKVPLNAGLLDAMFGGK
ncbi:phage tail assembly chaperone [Agrobacterium sp. rho-8.1]|nr:hypothetical protein [Agrobacterium sp. rho-8.1]